MALDERISGGRASTRYTGCRAPQADSHPEFWEMVRRLDHFPMGCPICGADIPQWTVPRPATHIAAKDDRTFTTTTAGLRAA